MGRSKRVRVSQGIYRDATGYTVVARIGSAGKNLQSSPEIRFPLEPSPADYKHHLAHMQARYLREKAALAEQRTAPAKRGTLAADVELYLKTAQLTKRRADERRQQLKWWTDQIGDKSRARLEPGELRRLLNGLKGSASTRNKYRTALSNMYTVLDGKSAYNPFRDVERDAEPDAARRDQPTILVDRILAHMRDTGQAGQPSRTKARFRVLAYCPVTPAQLCRMQESDVDLVARVIYPGGRQKGAGTLAQAKAIDADGIAAFEAFAAAGCWQAQAKTPPSRASMYRTFTAARDAAIAELLKENRPELAGDLARAKTMRPYDLRHSFAFAAAQATSIETAGLLLDHKDRRTTLRYAQGAVPEHLRAARDAIAAQRARDRQAAAKPTL
jgi:integrase